MSATVMPRIAVLISGAGSNARALIEASNKGALSAQVATVISNRPDAPGLAIAEAAGIPTQIIDHRQFNSRGDFDRALIAALQPLQPDLVVLAGFMRILTDDFIHAFADRLLNIHPSLLPKYTGLHTHRRAIAAGDAQAGATVHFVTPELDGGPPVIQASVPILGDDELGLAQRVQQQEHVIYPIAAQWFVTGRLKLTAQGAVLDGQLLPKSGARHSPTGGDTHS